ncbi:MAG: SPFH domain-containing protein [Gemmatimonadetes bacterium]|nr:SPFH domain-containing protein [Gemmatimonadota bacterium]MBK6779694.1 SPFH domain-containing protein [Gemmatimonadota bacterium]MBK7923561.1 SPFH domain-containing protein [Gemmatimonadota bacterium]MBK9691962.1 SPFH domain-containing protein [Gemmatimonadota bacterium]MBP9200076.1 SPFH domain-containing protein [Gemmatimonadales bacterium]
MLALLLLGSVAVLYGFISAIRTESVGLLLPSLGAMLLLIILWCGLFTVQPNQSRVLQLFGDYVGSVRTAGLWWANPFFSKKAVSLRVRNFETTKLKVNDHSSNPIEIGAVVVWQVTDAAEALFEVDNYEDYVKVQSEAALRGLANQYPYDAHEEGQMSLSTNTMDVAERLKGEIQERLAKAGVRVLEARISHLAYAPEIAGVMLRRQQASAVIAARQKIVEGAVGMVESALALLSSKQIIHLDEERKATMVSNLLVVLCSEQSTQPILNAGSLYQ